MGFPAKLDKDDSFFSPPILGTSLPDRHLQLIAKPKKIINLMMSLFQTEINQIIG
jgi:hypothetical protein